MKKTLLVTLVALLVVLVAPALAQEPFAYLEFTTNEWNEAVDKYYGTNATGESFGPPGSTCYGAGDYAVVYLPGTADRNLGDCYFNWAPGDSAHQLALRVFDSPYEDSFEVQVLNKKGTYVTVYTYEDVDDITWKVHTPSLRFGAGKGQSTAASVRIVPTYAPNHPNPSCGQVAVDWVALYEYKEY
jgi:hypothetical protein